MIRFLFLLVLPLNVFAQTSLSPKAIHSVDAFLQALDSVQKKKTQFPFSSDSRYSWHYLPASQVHRYGICLKDLSQHQQELSYLMLKEFLSAEGFEKTTHIIQYEKLLKEMEPSNHSRIPDNYFIALYGQPADSLWGWRITGHHLTLNFTIVNGKLSWTPFFFGAYPATIKEGPQKGKRLFANEEDLALQLINSMTKDQRSQAIFSETTFMDILTTNAPHAEPLPEQGIIRKNMSQNQQMLLEKIILAYLSAMPHEIASKRLDRLLTEDPGSIRFAWAGALTAGKPHYYRIQGTTFLIEFDNSQHDANHIHTVWRDFNGDFGEDLLRMHYENMHRH